MDFLYIGILIIHLSLYSKLSGLHVQLHAISRCVDDACESGVGVYPHCTECNKFIYCIFGYAVERACPENLVFDITYGICNFPQNSKCWNSISLAPGRIGIERTFNKPSKSLFKKRDKKVNNDDKNQLLNKDDQAVEVKDLNSEFKVTLRSGDLPEEVTLKTDDPPEEVTMKTDDPPEEVTMKTDDQPEEVTMKTDDPSEEVTMKTDDKPEEVTMKTDDPPEEVTTKIDDPPEEVATKTDDSPEEVTTKTDDPPEVVTMKTDDPQEEMTLKTDDPLEDVTSKTDDSPEDVTSKTDDPREEVTMKTDDPPEEVTLKTDDPPEDVTSNKEDPPEEVTLKTDDPLEEVTVETDDPLEEWNREYSINPDIPQNEDPSEGNTAFKTNNQIDKQPLESSNGVLKVPCVKDCNGMPEGNYQSCDMCTKYVSCMWGMKLDNTCFSGLYWDDISKKCVSRSTTC